MKKYIAKKDEVDISQEINNILGYGKEIEVLFGISDDGSKDIRKIHITPAPLSKLPELYKLIDKVTSIEDFTSDEYIKNACSLIRIATERMHPELTVEVIGEKFGLAAMMKVIRVVADVNDFLSEARETEKMVKEVNKLNI